MLLQSQLFPHPGLLRPNMTMEIKQRLLSAGPWLGITDTLCPPSKQLYFKPAPEIPKRTWARCNQKQNAASCIPEEGQGVPGNKQRCCRPGPSAPPHPTQATARPAVLSSALRLPEPGRAQ